MVQGQKGLVCPAGAADYGPAFAVCCMVMVFLKSGGVSGNFYTDSSSPVGFAGFTSTSMYGASVLFTLEGVA
jgi:hypothetical protein